MSIYCSIKLTEDTQFDFYSEYPIKNKLDEISVIFKEKPNEVCIFIDTIQEAVTTIYRGLSKCVTNQMTLNSTLDIGRVGEKWNVWTNDLSDEVGEDEEDVYQEYWIWSSRDFQTWVYQKDGKSYIELSPSYRWHYVEPIENEEVIPFEAFMKGYKPTVIKITSEQLTILLDSLSKIKHDLGIS
ncbi:hypothetical protein ACFPVX_04700 [Cohnella faecalis]|uniref:Uncharacterized protein n=1 Tax=Cohnella faecalis TaxID=2315694 RepID=A0A398CRT9_9BACL|nr:hypothetical protein [Cohnella faecalis]RIE03929.1 hypothetical protein D3H35_08165 [Cohnella faecalis]